MMEDFPSGHRVISMVLIDNRESSPKSVVTISHVKHFVRELFPGRVGKQLALELLILLLPQWALVLNISLTDLGCLPLMILEHHIKYSVAIHIPHTQKVSS